MKYTRSLLLLLLFCVFAPALPCGAQAENPGYMEISAPELKTMLDEKNCLLVHALSRIEYEIQHIEGSINIPVIEMNTTTLLPKNKAMPLIFYCMGTR